MDAQTMQALVVRSLGWPNPMRVEPWPVPEPRADEVLVRVDAAGLNFADMLALAGDYQEKAQLPFVPGAECSGTVVRCGAQVAGVRPGDRVMGQVASGAYAQYVAMHQHRLAPVPAGMGAEEAAGFYIPYGTALSALGARGRLRPGETVLVLGAAGGVGQAAVQVAKALGARVIGATGTIDKREAVLAAGADHHLVYGDGALRDTVMAVTAGAGVDVVFDTVGGAATEQALRCLAFEGRLLLIGFTSGQVPTLRANHVLVKNIDVAGCFWGPYQQRKPEATRAEFARLAQWFDAGLLRPHVADMVRLQDIPAALERLGARGYAGKVVARMQDDTRN